MDPATAMAPAPTLDLREEWADLLRRRPALAAALVPYGPILEAWAGWAPASVTPLGWGAAECAGRWARGVPLLAEAPPPVVSPAALEPLVGVALDVLSGLGPAEAASLQRFAEAWDRGEVGLETLLPALERPGPSAPGTDPGLSRGLLAFLGYASLRPLLHVYLAECRLHGGHDQWAFGVCPFCGAPPAWADLVEDGRRRLACHLCGGSWTFSRVACPFCANRTAREFSRLQAEGPEEGYAIDACLNCRGYLKGLDRRVRWNAGSALVEDWGSPHLDLVARRAGYWRALPTLIELGQAT